MENPHFQTKRSRLTAILLPLAIWLGLLAWFLDLGLHLVAVENGAVHFSGLTAAALLPRVVIGLGLVSALWQEKHDRASHTAPHPEPTPQPANSTAQTTAYEQLEATFHESEAQYRALLAQSNDAIYLLQDGQLIFVNRRFEEMFGYTQEEITNPGINLLSLVAPEYHDIIWRRSQLFQAGRVAEIPTRYEFVALARDGREIEVETSISYITYRGKTAIQGILRDITEQKRSEREKELLLATLQHRTTQLQTAAEVSKSASTILDPAVLITEVVNLIRERFGFYYVGLFLVDETGQYAILRAGTGEAGRKMIAEGHRLRVGGDSMIGACIAAHGPRIALDVDREAIRLDNPHLPDTRSEMALPMITRGQCIGALTIQSTEEAAFSDQDVAALNTMAEQIAIALENARLYAAAQQEIMRRLAAEEALRQLNETLERRVAERTAELNAANKELATFAYSVSHDLRAPLRSIRGFGQALQEDHGHRLDAEGQDYLARILAASQRMGQLIEDLLTLSRVTQSTLNREQVDLSAMARQIAAELTRQDPERSVRFTITPDLTASGDPRLLRIVLENLLGNAWKFTRSRPEARITFDETTEGDQTVYFIQDNGAGFDMAYADRLFRPFQRLHSAGEFEGTGIGLATVQRIIHRHGGRVWAEGEPGRGATFYFTLTAAPEPFLES